MPDRVDLPKTQFDRSYFDAGETRPGYFSTYSWDNYGQEARTTADLLFRWFSPRTVLDVGCAKGFLLRAIKDKGSAVQGVDISKYALSCADQEVRQRTFLLDVNREKLPFVDRTFDLVTCFGTVEFLTNYDHAVMEMARVLKDRGILVIKTAYRRADATDPRLICHRRGWWIQYFRSRDFEYLKAQSDELRGELLRVMAESVVNRGCTWRAKIGRHVYGLGYVGRKIAARLRSDAAMVVLVLRKNGSR